MEVTQEQILDLLIDLFPNVHILIITNPFKNK